MFIKKPFIFRKFDRGRLGRGFVKQNNDKVNEQIRVSQVRVVDETGVNLGILNTQEAIKIAKDKKLDLVEISDKTDPPICKIIDYGKYKYTQEKKDKKQQAHQKRSEIKGIRVGLTTSPHDLEIRAHQIEKFFKEGHKVRVEMKLKGREKAHFDLARERLELFISTIHGGIKQEEEIKRSPQGLTTTICQGKQEDRSQNDSK
jgi:translation initiation factor IF-3